MRVCVYVCVGGGGRISFTVVVIHIVVHYIIEKQMKWVVSRQRRKLRVTVTVSV